MKISREKLFKMYDVFERLAMSKDNVRFHYLIIKNKRLIQPEIDSIREIGTPTKEYQEFDKKRMQTCNEYCLKDDNGEVVVKNNNFVIPEDVQDKFNGIIDELKEEYAETLSLAEKAKKEIDELLLEEIEIPFVFIPMNVIPEKLAGYEVETLFDIIESEA